jgi:sugar O-acyltransferase (sialic acid O-acetyltransferase NeuD family)
MSRVSLETSDLVIVGAGGAGSEARWIAGIMRPAFACVGFLDDNSERWGATNDGLPILGGVARAAALVDPERTLVHVAVGRGAARARLVAILKTQGFAFATLIHPQSVIAESATIGTGTMIGPFAVLAPHVKVDEHVLVNSHVGVGHHATVGAYSTLCPGVRVSGHCVVGKGVFLGSNAVILPGMAIGDGATVAASSMVVRRVAPRHTVMGVPARIVSKPADSESTAQS